MTSTSRYYLDRANGPRTRDFPRWSDTALWHEDLQCYAHGVRHWPDHEIVRIYVAAGNCTDFCGTLYCVLLDNDSCVVPVRRVEIFAGPKLDRVYLCDTNGDWHPYLPDRLPDALDDGDVLELPPTHEEQTPAGWLPKMPFARRPGTASANIIAQAKADAVARVNERVDRKVRELEQVRAETLKGLDTRIDAVLRGGK